MGGEISMERILAHLRAAVVQPGGGFIGESAREDITALELVLHQTEGSFVQLSVVDFKTAQKKKFVTGYLERVVVPNALASVSPSSPILSPEEQAAIMESYKILFILKTTSQPHELSVSIDLYQTVNISGEGKYEKVSLNVLIFRKATEQEKKMYLLNGRKCPSVPTEISKTCAVSA